MRKVLGAGAPLWGVPGEPFTLRSGLQILRGVPAAGGPSPHTLRQRT